MNQFYSNNWKNTNDHIFQNKMMNEIIIAPKYGDFFFVYQLTYRRIKTNIGKVWVNSRSVSHKYILQIQGQLKKKSNQQPMKLLYIYYKNN